MEKQEKPRLESSHTLKEPIIEYSIAAVGLIAFIVLLIVTGFYWGYLFILIVPVFFIIDGIVTHKRILRYRKQSLEKQNNNNPL